MIINDMKCKYEIEEYKQIRAEMLSCNKNAHNFLNKGFAFIITIISAGLASSTLDKFQLITVVFFIIIVPYFIYMVFNFWFGEIVRQQRAEGYLLELETKINVIEGEKKLCWHHEWLRIGTESPLRGLLYDHYANMALSFVVMILFCEIISIYMMAKLNISINQYITLAILPLFISTYFLFIIRQKIHKFFKYDLFKKIFGFPWMSIICLFVRIFLFFIINIHILGWINLDSFKVIYVFILIIFSDSIDGKLVRLYASKYSKPFRIADSAIDMSSIIITSLILYLNNIFSGQIFLTILAREFVITIGISYILLSGFDKPIIANHFGRAFCIFWVVIVLNNLIGPWFNQTILLYCLIVISIISVVSYSSYYFKNYD